MVDAVKNGCIDWGELWCGEWVDDKVNALARVQFLYIMNAHDCRENEMQHFESYDPLTVANQDDELLVAARKREIRNILKSYTGYYDPFAEVLQNAFDAVEKRAREEGEDYLPQIWITVNVCDKEISVTDNGCGMDFSEFKMFLKPNYSFKSGTGTRGMKGVGATYLAYGFNHLRVSTKRNGKEWVGRILNGRRWVDDDSGLMDVPMFSVADEPSHQPFAEIDNGTSVTIHLVGDGIRPKDLSWAGAVDANQWLALLRVHTPLGAIYIEPDRSSFAIRINVEVVDANGAISAKSIENPEYFYPHKVFDPVVNLRDFLSWQADQVSKGRLTTRIPGKFRNLSGFWITGDTDELLTNERLFPLRLTNEQRDLVFELNVRVYFFMCYTIELWKNLKKELNLHTRSQFLRGGLQIATRHMPQGPLLPIKLNRMLGFQNITHIIVHIDAEPDLGRKGFQPEHVSLAEHIAQRLVEQYGANYRWELLRRRDGTVSMVKELELQNWIDQQRIHEEKYPLKIEKPQVFKPLFYLPTRSEPQVEQDVVSLFNQMLSAGIIRGIVMLSSSQYLQYDGLYRRILDTPYSTYVYDPDSNPLGVIRDLLGSEEKPLQSGIRVLEFKFSLDDLVEELSLQEKDVRALDLVVAWERGTTWNKTYSVTSYLTPDNIRQREYHGYTHSFEDMMSRQVAFNAIILKDLISYLNDPVAEEKRQALLEDQS